MPHDGRGIKCLLKFKKGENQTTQSEVQALPVCDLEQWKLLLGHPSCVLVLAQNLRERKGQVGIPVMFPLGCTLNSSPTL